MQTVEQIIETQLADLLKTWKPRFGKQTDIDLVTQISKMNRLEKELAEKIKAQKGAQAITDELKRLKRNLLTQLKQNA